MLITSTGREFRYTITYERMMHQLRRIAEHSRMVADDTTRTDNIRCHVHKEHLAVTAAIAILEVYLKERDVTA